jgi:hypothetical protein
MESLSLFFFTSASFFLITFYILDSFTNYSLDKIILGFNMSKRINYLVL